jgi:restriction endonuclease
LLAQGRWFSPGTPASSTTKTGRHDIADILLKVALNTKIQNSNSNSEITFIMYDWKAKLFKSIWEQENQRAYTGW